MLWALSLSLKSCGELHMLMCEMCVLTSHRIPVDSNSSEIPTLSI